MLLLNPCPSVYWTGGGDRWPNGSLPALGSGQKAVPEVTVWWPPSLQVW